MEREAKILEGVLGYGRTGSIIVQAVQKKSMK